MREILKYASVLLLILLSGIILFHYQTSRQIDGIIRKELQDAYKRFFASQSAFDKLSKSFYNDHHDYIARILAMAEEDKSDTRVLRDELLSRLYPAYHNARHFGLYQFQVHDARGRSFLRFNHPESYGDDLRSVRPSLRRMLSEKRFLKGFEVGRYVDGLRYLFPLFYDGAYVGSYEWVWNHVALVRELHSIYGGRYAIIVHSREMDPIVLPEEIRRRYGSFRPCREYLYDRSAFALYGPHFTRELYGIFSGENACARLTAERDFALVREINATTYLLRAVALQTVTGRPYGYFLSFGPEPRIRSIETLFLVESFLLLLGLLLIFLLLYRSNRDKTFVRTLLDSQKDMVLLTNGKRISDANKRFLEFFDVQTPREFQERYGCVCNLFVEEEGYVGRNNDGKSWLEYIRENERENRVIMFDRLRGEERVFMVSLDRFDNTGLYVVSFRDITELEREKRHFKIESMMDHLTGLYNKRSFEHYLGERLRALREDPREGEALVMFDIDRFKSINDRFGHRTGDEVLRHLAALVQSKMRRSDYLARWGGEEFVIVMEGSGLEGACRKAETLRTIIAEEDFGIPGGLRCSFGVTVLRPDDTIETAQERVDRLLYRAKNTGRNRVVCEA